MTEDKFIGKWLWVIGGGLLQVPLINEAKALGLKVVVSDASDACAAFQHADFFLKIDIFDIDGHLQSLDQLDFTVQGVLAAGIDAPETMAAMNQKLGLKGVSVDVARISQQKDLFRQKMQEMGYSTPKFMVVDVTSDLLSEIQQLGLPLIVKPPANSASRDMKIFYPGEAELCASFIQSILSKYDRVLLEEVWQGEEQTVECLVDIDGNFHRGFITDRKFRFDKGFPVETGLVHPTELNNEAQEQLYQLAEQVAKDFGIQAGAVKLDSMMTAEGPRLIELAVRHSGGFDCQYLVPLSTGKNILKAAIYTAMQVAFPPELLQPKWQKFGMTGSVWPNPGVIKEIDGLDEAVSIKGIEHIFLRYQLGDEVLPYEDCSRRVAFIIAVTDSRADTQQVLSQAIESLRIVTE